MRFDDMLATVLARTAASPIARVLQWRQLVDLLAQRRAGADPRALREALARLDGLRAQVPVEVRRETARAVAGRPVPPMLVAILAADVPLVAGAILSQVRLAEEEWIAILPRLTPTGRAFLRHRDDLGGGVASALAGFGAVDLSLHAAAPVEAPGAVAPQPQAEAPAAPAEQVEAADEEGAPEAEEPTAPDAPGDDAAPASAETPAEASAAAEPAPSEPFEPADGQGQIRAIIHRIARFREARPDPLAVQPRPAPPIERFRFETDADGVIRWIDGAPRGPLIGATIAIAANGAYGVDAQAPGAFRRRAPFRDARLTVAGDGPAAGAWRLAGVPVFAPATGRFLGYRCTARRPRPDESAAAAPLPRQGLYGGGLEADSLRQLVHELRTPLNAIGGFAEMIRRQLRGPADAAYRERAQRIVAEAGRLLAAVDDLDVAARLDTQRLELRRAEIDLPTLLEAVIAEQAELGERLGAGLILDLPPALPPLVGDPAAVRRIVARLIGSALALAGPAERILVTAEARPGSLALAVARPARLAGATDRELTDPGYGPEGDWPDAPLLGLGFSLRLVRHLAAAGGGLLTIAPTRFTVRLPAGAGAAGARADG